MDNIIENYQRMLFPYAYNVIGTVEDAEDVIQDVIIRFSKMETEKIDNPKNYLIKSVINQAIELKRKKIKSISIDVWLPEPVVTDTDHRHDEIANFSLLSRMESLNPKERAVFILKEGFDYSHEEIGGLLSYTPENSRKILSRAREKLKKLGYTIKTRSKSSDAVPIMNLIEAIQKKDTQGVKRLLTDDIQFYADGGTRIKVVARECLGNDLVSQLLIYIHHTYNNSFDFSFTTLNHQPAILYKENGCIQSCQIFEVKENKILRIESVIDLQKLKKLGISQT